MRLLVADRQLQQLLFLLLSLTGLAKKIHRAHAFGL